MWDACTFVMDHQTTPAFGFHFDILAYNLENTQCLDPRKAWGHAPHYGNGLRQMIHGLRFSNSRVLTLLCVPGYL
jgi:hypothetical protein